MGANWLIIAAKGDEGPEGPTGGTGGSFAYEQITPSATWTIDHNLGYIPNVTVIDGLGREVMGDIAHPTLNQTVLTFSAMFSGDAYLS